MGGVLEGAAGDVDDQDAVAAVGACGVERARHVPGVGAAVAGAFGDAVAGDAVGGWAGAELEGDVACGAGPGLELVC